MTEDCGCHKVDIEARTEDYRANRAQVHAHSFRANLLESQVRSEVLSGVDYLVVPVVMARADVVMNGALVPEEEFFPEAWNGVPVTVGHPELPADGGFTTANSPEILETWAVGVILNARIENGALKAEAWIDKGRAAKNYASLIPDLVSGASMDVSTGYYSKDEKRRGVSNGRQYQRISRDLLPDHLALLPGDTGACSWEDGCGVRNASMKDKIKSALETIGDAITGKFNERGDDDDSRQMIADMISNDKSPFIPDDMYALQEMSYGTLKKMRDTYLGEVAEVKEPETNTNKGGHDLADKDKPEVKANASETELPKTVGELNTLIANAVTTALKPVTETLQGLSTNSSLSDDDRVALSAARKISDEHRNRLVTHVTANSAITEDQAKAMDLGTLEIVANGLQLPTSYAGRPSPQVNALEEKDPAVEAMVPMSAGDLIRNRASKAEVH